MHILYLSDSFVPENTAAAIRASEHACEWVSRGHDVTVLTCCPNFPRGEVFAGYKNRLLQRETINHINVVRVWTYIVPNAGVLKRVLDYVSYMISSVIGAMFIKKVDFVLATSPHFFTPIAGYIISRMRRIPFIFEVRDLWPDSISAVKAINNRIIIKLLSKIESYLYKRADRIIVVTNSTQDILVKRGILPEKICVATNGINIDEYEPDVNRIRYRAMLGYRDTDLVAAYIGTHGMAHHLETIIEAAQVTRNNNDLKYLMVGDGAHKGDLVKRAKEKGLTNIQMLSEQPKKKIQNYLAAADVSMVLLKRAKLFETVIPSKLFEAMAMKKPVILGVLGESTVLVKQANCGIAITPESSRELADALVELQSNKEKIELLGENGRIYVAERFNRRKNAIKILNELHILSRKCSAVPKIKSQSVVD